MNMSIRCNYSGTAFNRNLDVDTSTEQVVSVAQRGNSVNMNSAIDQNPWCRKTNFYRDIVIPSNLCRHFFNSLVTKEVRIWRVISHGNKIAEMAHVNNINGASLNKSPVIPHSLHKLCPKQVKYL